MRTSGLIQVYTGNGKGKTTAALGLALRARGAGKRVAVVFFDKGGDHYSERKILGQLGVDWFGYGMDRMDPTTNRFRFGVLSKDTAQAEQGIAKAMGLLQQFFPIPTGAVLPLPPAGGARGGSCEARGGGGGPQPYYDLLILDEINTVVALGMVSEKSVERLIEMKPDALELVLTGRTEVMRESASSRVQNEGSNTPGRPWPNGNEHQRWLSYFDRADLITEMRLERHYFYSGVPVRAGLDY